MKKWIRRAQPTADRSSAPADGAQQGSGDVDLRARRALFRLNRTVQGEETTVADLADPVLDPAENRAAIVTARRLRAQSDLVELLARGESLEAATVSCVHELFAAGARHVAGGLVAGIAHLPGGDLAHRLGLALIAQNSMFGDLAYERFLLIDDRDIARYAPVDGVDAFVRSDRPEGRERARGVATQLDALSVAALVEVGARMLVIGEDDLARRLVDEAAERGTDALDAAQRRQLTVVADWLKDKPAPDVPEGAAVIGVIDYHQPDQTRASSNVGDYVQTLAMLGNLARWSQCRFSGDGDLGQIVSDLQGRVATHHPELVLDGPAGTAHVIGVNRDFSRLDSIPDNTWMIAFGWHMHSLFDLGFGFPYHPNIKPVFVSFHLNRPKVLTPEAKEYLRTHGPVGCRDWGTVDILLSEGIDAFFTGCLTSTVNAAFPDAADLDAAPDTVGLIDVGPDAGARIRRPVERLTHAGQEFREASLSEGVAAAIELLERYQHQFARIVTSRLHSYLPATSLGIPVKFTPVNPSDVRFDGLAGMTPDNMAFTTMRDDIRALLAETFGLIVGGADEETVYGRWRELTADRVAYAKTRHHADPPLKPHDIDVVSGVRTEAARSAVSEPGVTDIALSLDQNLRTQLPVTLEAMTSNASGPLRLWILGRGLDEEYQRWLAGAFPATTINFVPCDEVDYGTVARMISHITISTMDRLLLPELLPGLDRITYIDIDAVVEGDVCELAATELGDSPLAARPSIWWAYTLWQQTGNHLEPEVAHRLRRTMAAKMPASLPTINAGILVLNLARMRSDGFTAWALSAVATYGLNDQDLLLAYVGAERTELDRRWNHWPSMEVADDPAIVHFVGAGKPWSPYLSPGSEVWEKWADVSAQRVGRPPSGAG